MKGKKKDIDASDSLGEWIMKMNNDPSLFPNSALRNEFVKQLNCLWNYIMIRHVRKTHAGNGNVYVCPYCNFYCVHKAVYKLHLSENGKPFE